MLARVPIRGFFSLFPEFFGSFDKLCVVFVGATANSCIEDAIVTAVSFLVGVPILVAISKLKVFKRGTTEKMTSELSVVIKGPQMPKRTAILKPHLL